MLELINRIEQHIEHEDLSIDLLRRARDLLAQHQSIMHEQRVMFFALCGLVIFLLLVLIYMKGRK